MHADLALGGAHSGCRARLHVCEAAAGPGGAAPLEGLEVGAALKVGASAGPS